MEKLIMEVQLDMDGVLADFSKAINSSRGINNLVDNIRRLVALDPRCRGYVDLIVDAGSARYYGLTAASLLLADSKDSNLSLADNEVAAACHKRMIAATTELKRATYKLASAPGFFLKLDMMPDADVLVDTVIDMCDGGGCQISSPRQFIHPRPVWPISAHGWTSTFMASSGTSMQPRTSGRTHHPRRS